MSPIAKADASKLASAARDLGADDCRHYSCLICLSNSSPSSVVIAGNHVISAMSSHAAFSAQD
jgi:hypothetical protein